MSVGDGKQRIRERAYELWERDGRPHGRHLDHWAEAERETGSGHAGLFEHSAGKGERETPRPSGAEPGFGAVAPSEPAGREAGEMRTLGQPARATETGQPPPEKPSRSRRKPEERQGEPAPKRGRRKE